MKDIDTAYADPWVQYYTDEYQTNLSQPSTKEQYKLHIAIPKDNYAIIMKRLMTFFRMPFKMEPFKVLR